MAAIELGTVKAVDMIAYTVDVAMDRTSQYLRGLAIATPYQHPKHAGGVLFMPEVDARCYVAYPDGPADKSAPFVFAFTCDPIAETKMDYSGMKEPLEPGDQGIRSADGNYVIVRRGGLIEIISTALCGRMYIPVQNTIRDYFQRYQAITPLGEIEWGHATLTHVNSDGSTKFDGVDETAVLVKYSIKELAQEDTSKHHTVELRVGRLDKDSLDMAIDAEHVFADPSVGGSSGDLSDAGKGVLSLVIHSHGSDGQQTAEAVYAMQFNRDGHVHMFSAGKIQIISPEMTLIGDVKIGKSADKSLVTWDDLHTYLASLTGTFTGTITIGGTPSAATGTIAGFTELPTSAKAKHIKVE